MSAVCAYAGTTPRSLSQAHQRQRLDVCLPSMPRDREPLAVEPQPDGTDNHRLMGIAHARHTECGYASWDLIPVTGRHCVDQNPVLGGGIMLQGVHIGLNVDAARTSRVNAF